MRYRNQIARAALGVAIVIGTATTIKSQDPDVATRRAYGDHDFIPAPISEHIADGIPGAWLRVLKFCEHFAYLECADDGPPGAERFLSLERRRRAAPVTGTSQGWSRILDHELQPDRAA